MKKFLTILLSLVVSSSSIFIPKLTKFRSRNRFDTIQQGTENEAATLKDLSYRLDIVECPDAKILEQQSVTYQTYIFYHIWQRKHVCCSWLLRDQSKTLEPNSDREVTFEVNDFGSQIVKHFQYSCPKRGRIIEMSVNLPRRAKIGDGEVCLDYLSIVFDNNTNTECEFCATSTYQFETDKDLLNSCSNLQRRFREISVTFRSGVRLYKEQTEGFIVTIKCDEELSEQQENCLYIDSELNTMDYFDTLHKGTSQWNNLEHVEYDYWRQEPMNEMSVIPVDAKQALLQFHYEQHSKISFARGMNNPSDILKLALLSERSCDEEISTLAYEVVNLFPEEVVMKAKQQY